MKSLVVVSSYHHRNTQKIAEAMAKVLDAQVKSPQETAPEELQQFDVVGFGSGIDSGKHYKQMLDFADKLPQAANKKAFIFSTSGVATTKYMVKIHTLLREKPSVKGLHYCR
jgi:flavodoxin